MPKQTGTPGNTMQSQVDFDRVMVKLGVALRQMEHWCEKTVSEWGEVKSIRFRAPENSGGEWLAVVSVTTKDGGVVGFHSGEDLTATLSGLSSRLRNGSIQWKEDQYA